MDSKHSSRPAATGRAKQNHDLSECLAEAEDLGLILSDADREGIQLLNQMYFRNDEFAWKYPARYPMDESKSFGYALPNFPWLQKAVRSFVSQAHQLPH